MKWLFSTFRMFKLPPSIQGCVNQIVEQAVLRTGYYPHLISSPFAIVHFLDSRRSGDGRRDKQNSIRVAEQILSLSARDTNKRLKYCAMTFWDEGSFAATRDGQRNSQIASAKVISTRHSKSNQPPPVAVAVQRLPTTQSPPTTTITTAKDIATSTTTVRQH